jgi:hypothetical protein
MFVCVLIITIFNVLLATTCVTHFSYSNIKRLAFLEIYLSQVKCTMCIPESLIQFYLCHGDVQHPMPHFMLLHCHFFQCIVEIALSFIHHGFVEIKFLNRTVSYPLDILIIHPAPSSNTNTLLCM